jgi:hypothetical protein
MNERVEELRVLAREGRARPVDSRAPASKLSPIFAGRGAASIAALQREAGNRAVAGLVQSWAVQRHGDFEPVPEGEEEPEVTVDASGGSGEGVVSAPEELAPEHEEGSSAPVARSGITVSRDDIPPPPPDYPSKMELATAHLANSDYDDNIPSSLGHLWGMTIQDGLERGFPIYWNEKSGKVSLGQTELGPPHKPGARATITIPMDDPGKGTYTVGSGHTHPPPAPGYQAVTVGPSDVDISNLGKKHPGFVHDFSTKACKKGDKGGLYFFGPDERTGY